MTGLEEPFAPVLEVAELMAGFDRPWFIAGGWAIDLFLAKVTRAHEDVDVAILRRDQRSVRAHLVGWEFEKVTRVRRNPWGEGEWLNPPVHEVHARRSAGAPREFQLLLNESIDDDWVFRKDARISRPLSKATLRSNGGIPYFGPELVLLYKAKDPKAKDLADFDRTQPRLGFRRRLWLRGALENCYPGHPWIGQL